MYTVCLIIQLLISVANRKICGKILPKHLQQRIMRKDSI